MRLHPNVRVFGRQRTRATQLRVAATRRKTRRDRIAQPVLAMPALDQRLGVNQALFGLVAHAIGRVPVHQALASDEPQLPLLRLFEQGVD